MNPADFQANTPYARFGDIAIDAPVDARRRLSARRTCNLMFAIYAFVALEYLLFPLGWEVRAIQLHRQHAAFAWLLVLGAFFIVSMVANRWAQSGTSPGMQYAGLYLYVVAEALIFLPLLALAKMQTIQLQGVGNVGVIPAAGMTTLIIFGGLTAFT